MPGKPDVPEPLEAGGWRFELVPPGGSFGPRGELAYSQEAAEAFGGLPLVAFVDAGAGGRYAGCAPLTNLADRDGPAPGLMPGGRLCPATVYGVPYERAVRGEELELLGLWAHESLLALDTRRLRGGRAALVALPGGGEPRAMTALADFADSALLFDPESEDPFVAAFGYGGEDGGGAERWGELRRFGDAAAAWDAADPDVVENMTLRWSRAELEAQIRLAVGRDLSDDEVAECVDGLNTPDLNVYVDTIEERSIDAVSDLARSWDENSCFLGARPDASWFADSREGKALAPWAGEGDPEPADRAELERLLLDGGALYSPEAGVLAQGFGADADGGRASSVRVSLVDPAEMAQGLIEGRLERVSDAGGSSVYFRHGQTESFDLDLLLDAMARMPESLWFEADGVGRTGDPAKNMEFFKRVSHCASASDGTKWRYEDASSRVLPSEQHLDAHVWATWTRRPAGGYVACRAREVNGQGSQSATMTFAETSTLTAAIGFCVSALSPDEVDSIDAIVDAGDSTPHEGRLFSEARESGMYYLGSQELLVDSDGRTFEIDEPLMIFTRLPASEIGPGNFVVGDEKSSEEIHDNDSLGVGLVDALYEYSGDGDHHSFWFRIPYGKAYCYTGIELEDEERAELKSEYAAVVGLLEGSIAAGRAFSIDSSMDGPTFVEKVGKSVHEAPLPSPQPAAHAAQPASRGPRR